MTFGPAQAASSLSIEVYPYEGGAFTLQGGQVVRATVVKNIRGTTPGTFEIELAPGGPLGVESNPTWSEVITPMSFILIGGQRGKSAGIMLAGVVTEITEAQVWQTGEQGGQAARRQILKGQDFTWFFNSFNYYAMTFFGLAVGTALGEAMGFTPAGLPALIQQGLIGGSSSADSNPALLAKGWYNAIMAASGAILGKTFVPYQGNSQVYFRDALTTIWEPYADVFIPVGDFYWAAEGSWSAKFNAIFNAPFYEFFVTTAPSGAYGVTVSGNIGASGQQFHMQSLPAAPPAGPVVVARVNPFPTLTATVAAAGATPTFSSGLNMSRWSKLPVHDLTAAPFGFFASNISFSADEARNFFLLNPTWYRAMFGDSAANVSPFMYYMNGSADPASIHRYGYRPEIGTTRWLSDLTGNAAKNTSLNVPQTVATLTAKLSSYWEPLPLMARARATIPFSPDVLPGNIFRYAPFKGQAPWDFYLDAVQHDWTFGAVSTTTLTLSRGLPTSVYADSAASGVLVALHNGTAVRQNGVYTQRSADGVVAAIQKGTAPGLTPFGQPDSVQTLLGQIAQIYVTPQSK